MMSIGQFKLLWLSLSVRGDYRHPEVTALEVISVTFDHSSPGCLLIWDLSVRLLISFLMFCSLNVYMKEFN